MKSHELAKLLLENPDVELIMQKDSEGNGYSPLSGIEFDVVYIADSTWSGEVYSKCRSAAEHCMDVEEWKNLHKQSPTHAVLFPVN
jgi:hypothetical protein